MDAGNRGARRDGSMGRRNSGGVGTVDMVRHARKGGGGDSRIGIRSDGVVGRVRLINWLPMFSRRMIIHQGFVDNAATTVVFFLFSGSGRFPFAGGSGIRLARSASGGISGRVESRVITLDTCLIPGLRTLTGAAVSPVCHN